MKARELINVLNSLPPECNFFIPVIVENRWGEREFIWVEAMEADAISESNTLSDRRYEDNRED